MFLNKSYEQASVAFLRAGRNREAEICDAYLLREKARLISTTTSTARIQAFITAADAFNICAQASPPGHSNERLAYHRISGECYLEARDLKNAADHYHIAQQYAAAACTYHEGRYFDEMVQVITRNGNSLDRGLLERLTTAAQIHYFEVYFNARPVSKYF
jgi:hypothetical protein